MPVRVGGSGRKRDHVEANRISREITTLLQQLMRCCDDFPLLETIDAGRTIAVTVRRTQTDFDDK
jgi:hypothetical protein